MRGHRLFGKVPGSITEGQLILRQVKIHGVASPHPDGEIGFRLGIAAEPTGRDGFGFGIETHRLFAVGVLVAVERTLPAGEGEERQGRRGMAGLASDINCA
jgi:hypothetical protein